MDKGAHYYRCDLQVHSPLDAGWKGQGNGSEDERKAYAASLVSACRSAGLQAIAITDHHEMAFVPYVRRAAAEELGPDGKPYKPQERLVVLPGMELTLGVPCQALLVFDADFPEDMFALAAAALAIPPNDGAGTVRLDHIQSLVTLKQELDKHAYLRERYVVLPNVSDGQFSLLRTGQAGKYIEMPCDGGYVDGPVGKLGKGNKNILAGKAQAYGNRSIAVIQTSDNRNATHDRLGQHSTWIKWAVPSAEALRQACLARQSRIALTEPALPSVRIESLVVSNSSFLGPVTLELNPQYNAIIGGRGTGKSSILEYLRWGLCDQPSGEIEDGELPNYQRRRASLIEHTLEPVQGKVEIRFSVNASPHIVRRDSRTNALEIKVGDKPFEPCSEEQVRSLLPIQAYSQKQLSDVSTRLEELLRFITAPIKSQLETIDARLAEQAGIVREKYSARERRRALEATVTQRNLLRQSLQQQAAEIRKRLTGLDENDKALIDAAPRYQEAGRVVSSWSAGLHGSRTTLEQARQKIQASLTSASAAPTQPNQQALTTIRAAYVRALKSAIAAIQAAESDVIQVLNDATGETDGWRAWFKEVEEFDVRYKAAADRSSQHAQRLKDLAELERQTGELRDEAERLRLEIDALLEADLACDAAREQIALLRNQRADLLSEMCATLSERSGHLIRAAISRAANVERFIAVLKESLKGSGVRTNKIDALADAVSTAPDREQAYHTLVAELELLAVHHDTKAADAAVPEVRFLTQAGMSPSDVQRIARTLTQSEWLRLSLVWPEAEPVFDYRSKEDQYIPFANASAGQQATALLSTLLNSDGPPLVIDQPEEDLDNNVIQDVVEQIWTAKHQRQLIFSSHNANLVVNGDADLVVWCSYRSAGDQSGGKIAAEGAIDIPEVKDAITDVMEGGREAFKLRRQKYGF